MTHLFGSIGDTISPNPTKIHVNLHGSKYMKL